MQERPEEVPTGELPQNMTLIVDRHLVGKISPGTRVTVVGIYSIYQVLFDLHSGFQLFYLLECTSVSEHSCVQGSSATICDIACLLMCTVKVVATGSYQANAINPCVS